MIAFPNEKYFNIASNLLTKVLQVTRLLQVQVQVRSIIIEKGVQVQVVLTNN